MKLKQYLLAGAAFIALLGSCKKTDDYFVNPNSPTKATPATQLTALEVSTINTYEGGLARTAGLMVQHGVGTTGDAYPTTVYNLLESDMDNSWNQLYQALKNGQQLRVQYGKENPYYDGIALINMAMNWGVLIDLWGDVPYTQALQDSLYPFPKFDPQQLVLTAMDKMLDTAIMQLHRPKGDNLLLPGVDDVIFGGDTTLWVRTAYTLKARYLNRYSNKTTYNPAAILDALSKGISSSAEDCLGTHGPNANEQNQWYSYLNARAYIVAGRPLVDSMKLRPADMRVYAYFDSTGLGDVIGSDVDNPSQSVSYWGSYLAGGPAISTPIITYFEAKFIEAEVQARQGNGGAAAAALNAAIQANCARVTAGADDGSAIATYTATDATTDRVMYEKWIAMFGQIEAYNDYRRTGLPALTPNPAGTLNVIPKRLPTSQNERNTNPNAPTPALTVPVWWAVP